MKASSSGIKPSRLLLSFLPFFLSSLVVAQPLSKPALTSKTQVIQPMNNTQKITAFFYQQPVVLNRDDHKDLRLKPADASFAAGNQSVPLVAGEFPEAALEYPIVFAKSNEGRWMSLALTGLQVGRNAFVNEQGHWMARYVPASVRRYPFILAQGGQADDGQEQLALAADMAAPHLGEIGERLFDEQGEPTELARNVMALLADFQQQAARTHALGQALDEVQLLTQQNLQVRLGDGHEATVEGVWIVDEAKLRALADDKVLAWFKGGELAAIHAHMLSLRNLLPLLQRSQQAVSTAGSASDAKRDAKSKTKSNKQN